MKMWFWFVIEPVRQITAHDDADHTESRKDDDKGKTDLPEQLERLSRIIPHPKAHPFVHDNAGDKLHGCDKYDTSYKLKPQSVLPVYHSALYLKKQEADASKQKHRPM